jgi:hypothetical protein
MLGMRADSTWGSTATGGLELAAKHLDFFLVSGVRQAQFSSSCQNSKEGLQLTSV